MQVLGIRHLSAVAMNTLGGNTGGLYEHFFQTTTKRELDSAQSEYNTMLDGLTKKGLSEEDQEEVNDIVWNLVSAYIQFAHEDGVKTGIRLMKEAFQEE